MTDSCRAIIIKRREIENDLFVTLITQNGDRTELIAKGAAGPVSRRRGHLEPMNLIDCALYHSRNHIYLKEVVCVKSFSVLKSNLDSITKVQTLLNIVEKNTYPKNPDPELFTILLQTIESFDQAAPPKLSLEIALIKLADLFGLLPNFKECNSCHKILTALDAFWDQSEGTLHCSSCQSSASFPLELKYRKAIEFFRSSPRATLPNLKITPPESQTLLSLISDVCGGMGKGKLNTATAI